MKTNKIGEIASELIGINDGKIEVLDVGTKHDKHYLKFRDGDGKVDTIESIDFDTINKLVLKLGGRNLETVSAPDTFLELSTWRAKDLAELGHKIVGIKVDGRTKVVAKHYFFDLGADCGSPNVLNIKSKDDKRYNVKVSTQDYYRTQFTRNFSSPAQFDRLVKKLRQDPNGKKMSFKLDALYTVSTKTGERCVWKRVKAGDGTPRMILKLVTLGNKRFQQCLRQDIYKAADGMFSAPCQHIELVRPKDKTVCRHAAEDGRVDVSGYVAKR